MGHGRVDDPPPRQRTTRTGHLPLRGRSLRAMMDTLRGATSDRGITVGCATGLLRYCPTGQSRALRWQPSSTGPSTSSMTELSRFDVSLGDCARRRDRGNPNDQGREVHGVDDDTEPVWKVLSHAVGVFGVRFLSDLGLRYCGGSWVEQQGSLLRPGLDPVSSVPSRRRYRGRCDRFPRSGTPGASP